MSLWKHHGKLERHSLLLIIGIVLVVSIGGLVEIAPLFWLKSTVEKVEGVRSAKANLVFDPPWDASKMSDEAKLALNMF